MQISDMGRKARIFGSKLEGMQYIWSSAQENHMHEQAGEWKFFLGHFHHIKGSPFCSHWKTPDLLGFLYSIRKMRQTP